MMENQNLVPASEKRREILACLLGIPPTLFGLRKLSERSGAEQGMAQGLKSLLAWGALDLEEYRLTLEHYCTTSLAQTLSGAFKDIRRRLMALDHAALYAPVPRQRELLRLLCGYWLLLERIAYKHQLVAEAEGILDKVIAIAQEATLYDLWAYALRQRGVLLLNQGEVACFAQGVAAARPPVLAAKQAFDQALALGPHLSEQRWALVLLAASSASACLAESQQELTQALKMIEVAGKAIGKSSDDQDIPAKLDEERYHLDMGIALISAPVAKVQDPKRAREHLEQAAALSQPNSTIRHIENTIRQAQSYLVQGRYEMATAYSESAVPLVQATGSKSSFARLDGFHRSLQRSPYGSSGAVAHLGIQLLKVRRPELFAQ